MSAEPAGAIALDVRTTFALAWSKYRSHAPHILGLLLAWASVWVVVELLVVTSGSAPGQPVWSLLHLAYFWGTAYWEAAILARALGPFGGAVAWKPATRHHGRALRLLGLKLLLLPAVLAGTALFVVPGLYVAALYGLSVFYVVDRGMGVRAALAASRRASRGRRGRLMRIGLSLLLFNLLGAALLGLGLVVTVPMTALAAAHVFRTILSSPR